MNKFNLILINACPLSLCPVLLWCPVDEHCDVQTYWSSLDLQMWYEPLCPENEKTNILKYNEKSYYRIKLKGKEWW